MQTMSQISNWQMASFRQKKKKR